MQKTELLNVFRHLSLPPLTLQTYTRTAFHRADAAQVNADIWPAEGNVPPLQLLLISK